VLEERTSSRDSSGGIGKSVGFAADGEEEEALREVDPVPETDSLQIGTETTTSFVDSDAQHGVEVDGSRGIGESFALTESEEWAQSGMGNDSSDEQSEEYDEDEEEEGMDEGYED
jgi:peroxin-2